MGGILKLSTEDEIPQIQRIELFDPDALRELVKGAQFSPHKLNSGPFSATTTFLPLVSCGLSAGTLSGTIHNEGLLPCSEVTLSFISELPKPGRLKGSLFHRGDLIYYQPGAEIESCTEPGISWAALTLSPGEFSELAGMFDDDVPELLAQEYRILAPTAKATALLRRVISDALEIAQALPSRLSNPRLRTNLSRTLKACFLNALFSGHSEAGGKPPKVSSRYLILRRIEEYMMTHIGEPIHMADLCRVAGVSKRTVEYVFQQFFGISPMAYLLIRRLNGAHKELRRCGPAGVTVTEIASRWGFWHMGRFGAAYKALFNELPSQTLRRS